MPKYYEKKTEKNLTPFQKGGRCFGEFKCPECGRTWMSGNSWPNMGQQCQDCKIIVYPYEQRKLESRNARDRYDSLASHRSELCEKCKALGRNCSKNR